MRSNQSTEKNILLTKMIMYEKIIVDVRSEDEYRKERIKDSIDIPLSFIESRENRVAKLLAGKEVLLICRTDRRAKLAKQILAPHMEIEKIKVFK
jgi:rhodanese-related sulfurtransferase